MEIMVDTKLKPEPSTEKGEGSIAAEKATPVAPTVKVSPEKVSSNEKTEEPKQPTKPAMTGSDNTKGDSTSEIKFSPGEEESGLKFFRTILP